jgi:uncharacterized protein YegP (UPF0339 family)
MSWIDEMRIVLSALFEKGVGVKQVRFVIYKDKRGEYRWRLVAANGEPIADSAEGYVRRADCVAGVNLVRGASGAPVRSSAAKPVKPRKRARAKA